jgi:hypothetical protein
MHKHIYIYIYIHTHTHTYMGTYIYGICHGFDSSCLSIISFYLHHVVKFVELGVIVSGCVQKFACIYACITRSYLLKCDCVCTCMYLFSVWSAFSAAVALAVTVASEREWYRMYVYVCMVVFVIHEKPAFLCSKILKLINFSGPDSASLHSDRVTNVK